MAKLFPSITPDLQQFIESQHLFFVGTAPLSAEGHVNLSPKGLETFRMLSPLRVGYLDLTGSGNETSAHLQQNGRLTFLFCAFEGPPRILRLYGKGQVILPSHPDWETLSAGFPELPGCRQLIVADIHRVQTSCGFGVPLYAYEGQRETLLEWADKKGESALHEYQLAKGSQSIDGLPTPLAQDR
ncbi:MAG: pyridoxamine 5'-phosphate oxidase family protein [Leptolyngbyaceae cyanobacterium SM1_1_3]|nr:pyridoxamine 5'-phosphate oxidase family protein [Leptolyngbyaceae cyanobacterium SM1_1_3]NJN04328.1 pyridoxamine 5'-phosphate oxidase family protein [Leptolyngbyaceae cyanobacterium RM1_1_2]NJO10563.1 pyridoxamine 5'-phosphate oxidase family protein [Leptolyngbyaceae cyanobacterium SL_1_1]